jgi:NDP-sugar pyrophosphorylase family protein
MLAVILAAGSGTRMRPLTLHKPKALMELNGETFLSKQIRFVRSFGLEPLVTVGYLGNLTALEAKRHGCQRILDTNNQGNASFLNFEHIRNINEPVLVCTCDNFAEFDVYQLFHDMSSSNATHMLTKLETKDSTLQADRIVSKDGKILSIGRNIKSKIIAAGFQLLIPNRITLKKRIDNFDEVWKSAISQNRLELWSGRLSNWQALDYPEDLK